MIDELKLPYKEKHIKDLRADDIKVSISGTITNKIDARITMDDGTGSIIVNIETELNVGDFVKVYGNLLPYDEGYEIQGHFLKDLRNIDVNLYRKAMEIILNSK